MVRRTAGVTAGVKNAAQREPGGILKEGEKA
jgi:hypothetical protein